MSRSACASSTAGSKTRLCFLSNCESRVVASSASILERSSEAGFNLGRKESGNDFVKLRSPFEEIRVLVFQLQLFVDLRWYVRRESTRNQILRTGSIDLLPADLLKKKKSRIQPCSKAAQPLELRSSRHGHLVREQEDRIKSREQSRRQNALQVLLDGRIGVVPPRLRVRGAHDGTPGPGLQIRIGVEFKFRTSLNFRTFTVP